MDIKQMKSFIKKNIIDFTELVINRYNYLELDELDAMILIKLNYLLKKDIRIIDPKKLSYSLSVTPNTVSKRLNQLIEKDFITLTVSKGKDGLMSEEFHLDKLIDKIIVTEEIKSSNKKNKTPLNLIQMIEIELKRPLSVLEIQTLTKWIEEDGYTDFEIKEALYHAVKNNKLSIKYIDTLLLHKDDEVEEEPKLDYNPDFINDVKKLWEE
jgi:DNA replication protein